MSLKVVENQILNGYELISSLETLLHLDTNQLIIEINEGPDLLNIDFLNKNFIEFLNLFTEKSNIKKERIKIITYNLVQDLTVWPNIEIKHPVKYFVDAKKFEVIIQKKIKKHFGLFVGVSRWHRLYIASELFFKHKDKSLISYWQHHFNKFQVANLQIDELMMRLNAYNDTGIYNSLTNLLKNLPLHLSEKDIILNKNTGADISKGDWQTPYDLLPYYNEIFLDVVCETWHEGQCFLPNEKMARSLISKTPFVVYGSKNFLKNLKKLGFRTFDRWWSEDYDKLDGVRRIQSMFKIIDIISKKSIDDLKQTYVEMTAILEHNYHIIKSIDSNKMLALLK